MMCRSMAMPTHWRERGSDSTRLLRRINRQAPVRSLHPDSSTDHQSTGSESFVGDQLTELTMDSSSDAHGWVAAAAALQIMPPFSAAFTFWISSVISQQSVVRICLISKDTSCMEHDICCMAHSSWTHFSSQMLPWSDRHGMSDVYTTRFESMLRNLEKQQKYAMLLPS